MERRPSWSTDQRAALMNIEVVAALGAELGEGPIWDARSERLAWVDILGRRPMPCAPAVTNAFLPADLCMDFPLAEPNRWAERR